MPHFGYTTPKSLLYLSRYYILLGSFLRTFLLKDLNKLIIGKSLLWNHSPSEWFSLYKKARPSSKGRALPAVPPHVYAGLAPGASASTPCKQGYTPANNGCVRRSLLGAMPFGAKLEDVFTGTCHAPLINRLLSVWRSTCYLFFIIAFIVLNWVLL